MFFDLKSYLIGKHGGAYTPPADLPSWLMGKKKSFKKEAYSFHIDKETAEITYPEGSANENFAPAKMTANGFDAGDWGGTFIMAQCRPCMQKSDLTVDYYLDPSDYTKKLDGTPSDIADPDYDGNAMVEFPKIYYYFEADDESAEGGTFHIANYQVDENYHCWCNYDANNNEIDHFYMSIYNGIILDGKLRSLSGYALTNANGAGNTTATGEQAAARANNPTDKDEWFTWLISDYGLLALMATLIGKSVDCQSTFGRGVDSGSQAAKEAYITGSLNDKGLFWGSTTTGTQGVKLFGIENPYALCWSRVAGLVGSSTGYKYKMTHGTVDGSEATSFNLTGAGYIDLPTTKPATGWVVTMLFQPNGFWIPRTTGNANLFKVYYYNGNGYALVGGSAYNGAQDGFWYVNLYDAAWNRNWGFAARLSSKPLAR